MKTERVLMPEEEKKINRRGFLKAAGITLGVLGTGQIGLQLWKDRQRKEATADLIEGSTVGFNQAELGHLSEEANQAGALVTHTPFQPITPTSQASESLEAVPSPTPTPEIIRMAEGYVLSETIDLADHTKPIIMAIQLKKKKDWIISTIASPYSYTAENEKENIFHASKHTIETYIANENIPTTWMHAGTWDNEPVFAREFELFLRKPKGVTATPEEANKALQEELIGARVFVFQGENRQSFPKNVSDILTSPNDFDGNILEMTFSSGTRVPRWELDKNGELVVNEQGKLVDVIKTYSTHVMDTYDWLAQHYPNSNFSNVSKDNLWGIKFCSAPLKNETPCNAVNPIQYGRWILGLSVPKEGVKKVSFQPRKFA